MAHSKPHSVRKRMISNVYSKFYLQNSQDMDAISHCLLNKRLLPLLEDFATSEADVDVLELNYAVAMDFINAYLFGLLMGTDFISSEHIDKCFGFDSGEPFSKRFRHIYHCRKTYTFWPQELPRVTAFLHSFRIRVVPNFVDAANREIERWCKQMCKMTEEWATDPEIKKLNFSPRQVPVVYNQIASSLADAQYNSTTSNSRAAFESFPHPTDLTIASELLDQLAAGHETSGITLTYIMHELSKRLTLQALLRTELLTLSPSLQFVPTSPALSAPKPPLSPSPCRSHSLPEDLPSPRAVDALPLLHAIVMETLRLHAAIPGPQPRVTPSIPTTLAGYTDIPPHTRVSALPYTLHRNAAVFPEPNAWKPERWLDAGKEEKEEMMRWFWAFGSGGRMCVGRHFAVQEIKLVITAIYTNYTTKVVDDEGIEQDDGYTVGPVGNKLILRFEKLDSEKGERAQEGVGAT
ncbi:hypothetical protein MMC30_001123 [Trapelia coarctata]|nr:hypothetical protein [Trapelia coarctata]